MSARSCSRRMSLAAILSLGLLDSSVRGLTLRCSWPPGTRPPRWSPTMLPRRPSFVPVAAQDLGGPHHVVIVGPGALVLPPDLRVRAPPAQRDLDFDDEPGECGRHQVEATHDQAREDEYASRDRRGGDAITAVGEPHRLQHSDADQDDQPAHDVDPASAAASDERHGESDPVSYTHLRA